MPKMDASIRRPKCWLNTLPLLIFALSVAELRADQSVTIRSGNGPVGSRDTQVHFLQYGTIGDFTPSSANFTSAQTAPFAFIVSPFATYISSLPSDTSAKWISATPDLAAGSALYAVPFQITESVIASATLDLPYAVDNAINGVYINGTPISGNSHDGDYHAEYRFFRNDIAPLLRPSSTNWLYLNVSDYGALEALIFSATITVQGATAGTQSISPDHGGNTGKVTVRVIGSGFQPGIQLKLTGLGSDIIGANTTVVNANILISTFDLTNALPGLRTVLIINPDGSSTTVPSGFMIEQGGAPDVRIQIIGTPAVPGRNVTDFITLSNAGSVDSGVIPVVESLEPWFTFVSSAPPPTSIQQAPDLFPQSAIGTNYNAFLERDLPRVGAGASISLTKTVVLDPTFPVGQNVRGDACSDPPPPCRLRFIGCLGQAALDCRLIFCAPDRLLELGRKCGNDYADCLSGRPCAVSERGALGSVDPNDLTGPSGSGPQRWIMGDQPMPYAVLFENLPTATKPATDVTLTDSFNATTLDLATLSVGPISFGGSVYTPPSLPLMIAPFSRDVDLRPGQNLIVRVSAVLNPSTGQVTVKFVSIDPVTGLPPTNPLVGFLPPGVGGSVLLTVMPKSGLVTGTVIQNRATVVFDVNPPLNTPTWSNTIDNTKPVSRVSALPPTQTSYNFTVQWAGTDSGSGIKDFTVYVSDNGGPFTPWLTNATATEGSYMGVGGHTYSFYSIARDLAGNIENGKTLAEASTRVNLDTTPPAIVSQSSGTSGNNGWYKSNVTVSWNVTDPESGISSSSGCNTTNLTADTPGTNLTCAARNGAGLTNSASVTIKLDKTPPTVTYSGNAGTYTVEKSVSIVCSASDNLSGVASSTCQNITGPAYSFTLGVNSFSANATDNAGNVGSGSTSFTVQVTLASLCNLSERFVSQPGVGNALCEMLSTAAKAAAAGDLNAKAGAITAYINAVSAQTSFALTVQQGEILIRLAKAL